MSSHLESEPICFAQETRLTRGTNSACRGMRLSFFGSAGCRKETRPICSHFCESSVDWLSETNEDGCCCYSRVRKWIQARKARNWKTTLGFLGLQIVSES